MNPNLRKAAILIRSLDTETAAGLLAQLSPSEAKQVRTAIQSLGQVDPDERADVAAEFRRIGPLAVEDLRRGVELDVSLAAERTVSAASEPRGSGRPFEFLEQARVESLVPYLAREHGQTVAVILSYLPPARAAQVLAALPARLQSEALERLSVLGETDPSSLEVLERELADWVARQQATRSRSSQRSGALASILAAADESTRRGILANLLKHNRVLAEEIAPSMPAKTAGFDISLGPGQRQRGWQNKTRAPIADCGLPIDDHEALDAASEWQEPKAGRSPSAARTLQPCIRFVDLAMLDQSTLNAVLRAVDSEVLVLALAGGTDAVVERIAGQMPRAMAKSFRRRLCQLGPTRLRDVEAAQQEVTAVAAEMLQSRRLGL